MDFSDNPELQAIFQEEVGERSAELADAMRLMHMRLLSPDEATTARRNAHTIKGNSYVMGYQTMGDVAMLVEDTLKEVVAESRPQEGVLGELIAGISDQFPPAVVAGPTADLPELLHARNRLVAYLGGDVDPPIRLTSPMLRS